MLSAEHIHLRMMSSQAGIVYHQALLDYVSTMVANTSLNHVHERCEAYQEASATWKAALDSLNTYLWRLPQRATRDTEILRTKRTLDLLAIEEELIQPGRRMS